MLVATSYRTIGGPIDADDRFLVNAQHGDHDVVSGEPGLTPEIIQLTIEDGSVVQIEREARSSLSEGEWLLDEEQLEAIGVAMAEIRVVYPIDAEVGDAIDVLLDTEWKVLADGRLVIKQIRPFARQRE